MLKMKKAVLFVALGNVIFGFSFLASKIALRTANPVLLLAIRFTIAFVASDALLLLGAFKIRFREKGLGVLIPMSICQLVVYFLRKNYGLQYVASSFSRLMIAIIPAVTFLLTTIILGKPLRMNKFAWALCSVVGVCMISVTGGGDGGVSMKEVLFLMGAVASGSLYVVFNRKCSGTFTAVERTYVMFATGCVSFLTIVFTREGGNLVPARAQACKILEFAGAVLCLAVVSSIVVFFSVNYATAYLSVTQTSSFANPATLVSIVADVVLLGEAFGTKEIVGVVLILCGVFILNRADNKTAAVQK